MYHDSIFLFLVASVLFCGMLGCMCVRRRRVLVNENQTGEQQGTVLPGSQQLSSPYGALVHPQLFVWNPTLADSYTPQQASWGVPLQQQRAAETSSMCLPPDDSVFMYGRAEYIPRNIDSGVMNDTEVHSTGAVKDTK